jgi:hypothetical protein
MPDAGRGAALAREREPSRVEAIARAYVEASGGDARAALRLAIEDALICLIEMERRARRAERLVSRGFVRGAFGRAAR